MPETFEKNQDVADRIVALACLRELARKGILPYELWEKILNSYKGSSTIDIKWFLD